jgi:hypothetical protein
MGVDSPSDLLHFSLRVVSLVGVEMYFSRGARTRPGCEGMVHALRAVGTVTPGAESCR